jgi:hypothetical protein
VPISTLQIPIGAFSLTPLNHLIIQINSGILQVSLPENSSIQAETQNLPNNKMLYFGALKSA